VATPKIGTVECFNIRGRPPEIQKAVGFETVPGLDGVEAQTLGKPGGPFTMIAVKLGTHNEIETWLAQLAALAGAAGVEIALDDGSVFDKCYIGAPEANGVVVQEKTPCIIYPGGTSGFSCEVVVSGHRSST